MEKDLKIPKTVLEEIWNETIAHLKIDENYDTEIIEKLEPLLKNKNIDSEKIIDLLMIGADHEIN